jgi:hypothetical protein
MSDISAVIKENRVVHEFQNPILTKVYEWDPMTAIVIAGVSTTTEAVATHNIIAVPVGFAFLDAHVVVTEAFTSGGSATVQFKTGEANFTGAVPKADLTVGEVFHLNQNLAITAVVGAPYFVDGTTVTAETIDVAIGTADLTAGKAKFIVRFVDINNLQNG